MPDMIPMHADFAGNVNDYEPKSIGVVFGFPVLTVLFLMVCFIFSHWMMIRSEAPDQSGCACHLGARLWHVRSRAEHIPAGDRFAFVGRHRYRVHVVVGGRFSGWGRWRLSSSC